MSETAIIAGLIFIITYIMIVWEKFHRTVVALVGAMAVILTGIVSQEAAVEAIEFNTIGLLVGMMIIVSLTRRTGLFEFLALFIARKAEAQPGRLLIGLSVLTALSSAFLDNVTTVLLVVPITIEMVSVLKISPVPFLITEVIASNIGGASTLIGDPPNILIGGYTGLSFLSFLLNLGPIILVIFILVIAILWFLFRKHLEVEEEDRHKLMEMDESKAIKDTGLMKKSLVVLGLTIIGFILHGPLGMESATIALSGAALLLLLSRAKPEQILEGVEWNVIFFFVGLFILVGALEEVGIIESIARAGVSFTGGEKVSTAILIMWLSAIASSFVDNIPFVATMIPIVDEVGRLSAMENLNPWWWALALGGCLGGNGTLVGAAANLVVAGIAERRETPIDFLSYFKVGFPIMVLSVFIAMLYLIIFYL